MDDGCNRPPRVKIPKPRPTKSRSKRPADAHDLTDIQDHYTAFENSKAGVLVHVSSQHSILDVLYGGDTGRPMPSWTHQTTPEVSPSDQQHTGRCWIFATLAVLGHVFRSQYGISNARATFSEGYLGFWDLYEKSRLFLHVAYDTRCTPLDDPSLCDLLKTGISDGGDYIFCLNLLDKYGIVPTEYYPNSSYGSMSTEALVTLVNQVLRDNAITLRNTGDDSLIGPMLTNIFSLLCLGLGTPPAPWKKLDWQVDRCEVMAHYAIELDDQQLPPETTPWRPSAGYSVTVPRPPARPSQFSELLAAAGSSPPPPTTDEQPPSPTSSTATAAPAPPPPQPAAVAAVDYTDDRDMISSSSATVIVPPPAPEPGEPELTGIKPPRPIVEVSSSTLPCIDISKTKACGGKEGGGFKRLIRRLSPRGCGGEATDVPQEGSSEFFRETMPPTGGSRLLGGCVATEGACRLSHTMSPSRHKQEKPIVEDALSFDYTPREFYYRFLTGVKFTPVVCDIRFPSGTRIISNDANMYGGLASIYLNVTIDDIEEYAIASLKRNIPIWFACDVKKQLTPEGGRMCNHIDRLSELLPEPHEQGTKLQEIEHFNAVANHALLISAVSLKGKKPVAWRIVNSWGDVGRNGGVFVACGEWFREHVYAINAVHDTLSRQHKEDIDLRFSRPTVRLGPFDPSVI